MEVHSRDPLERLEIASPTEASDKEIRERKIERSAMRALQPEARGRAWLVGN